MSAPFTPSRRLLIALLVLAACPYFVNLGASSIWDANEAFYVETPREMMERGDYLFPTFNYEPRLNKPVLSYWIVGAFYAVLGISPAVQRVPIALGGLALVAVAFALARAAWPSGSGRDPSRAVDAGLWAAIGLAVSPRLVMFARRIFIDIYISVFMSLTLLFFALAERYPARRRTFLILMYAAVGLGTLTKGPVAIVLPALVFALYLAAHREIHRVRDMMVVPGALVVSAIVLPWYLALYRRDGWTHILSFVLGENVARFTDGVGVNAERGPLFYLPVVFSDAFPWSLLLPAAALWWFRDRAAGPGEDTTTRRLRTALWLWVLAIVGFFSMSQAKQDLYIFPIVPAVAALGGVALVRALSAAAPSPAVSWVRWAGFAAGLVLLVVGGGVIYLFGRGGGAGGSAGVSLEGVLLLGAMASVGGTFACAGALRRQTAAALLAVVTTLAAANWVIVLRVLPGFEKYKPVPAFAHVLAREAPPDAAIATYNTAVPSLVYYLRRHVDMAYDPAPIVGLLESDRQAFVILPRGDYEGIRAQTRARTCTIAAHPTLDMKLRNVLARDPPPELILITNRCQ